MKSEVLVFLILGAILGVLSTHGENGPIDSYVAFQSEDIEDFGRQSDMSYKGVMTKKVGKRNYKCTLDISYSLSPPLCTKSSAKCKPIPKKPVTFTIDTDYAELTVSVQKKKVTRCSVTPTVEAYETEMLKQLEFSAALANLNLNFEDEKNCTEELKTSLKKCKETEDVIEKLQFKKPFIRSTELTDRLGRDSRLFNALKETIGRVSSGWTSVGGGESLIKFFSQEFQDWAEKGGGLSILQTKPESVKSEDEDVTCGAYLLYRRMDGKCNNLADKYRGSAGIAMKRFFNNRYEDGSSVPRGGFPISSLPSARVVSRKMHHASEFPSPLTTKGYTHMVMQFGQFLDHDITLTADMEIDCCNPEIFSNDQNVCFNIDITADDFYSGKTTCHAFTRSLEIVTDSPTREQINGITAYIDASNVYGSDDVLAKNLRTLVNGRLKTHADGPMLPTRKQANLESHGPAQLDEDLVAGDIRAIEHPTLASIHSLFLSEHNRIAGDLKTRLSDFLSSKAQSEQDEIIYQESRKIVGAEMQNIVYNEFLPIVLGQDELTNHNLQLSTVTAYDDMVDASIRNEFATVAYRFGHSLVAGLFNGNGGHRLKLTYFDENPEFVSGLPPNNDGTAWYSELEQCAKQRCPADDVFCTEDVTNFLFSNTRGAATNFGDDLPARNIQRGRDHGLPSYNEFRSSCGLDTLTGFNTRPVEITAENWAKLSNTYNDVNDIDAFTGGLAETAPSDGLVGPTFACIIGKQFNFLKFGDRFFFNNDNANGLKVNSRETIRQRTLRDILCENTNAITLQKYVMKEEDAINNPQQECTSRNALDFDAIAADITGDGANFDLETRVTELEAMVEMMKAALTTKCDASQCNANTEALDTKCDATTCSNIHASTTDIETCLGDVSSLDCPSSPHGATGLAAALDDKCDASTCDALETTTPNDETSTPTPNDENIYVVGGRNKSGYYTNSVEVYNPGLNEWTQITSMPTPRHSMAVAVLNNELYVMGGYNGITGDGQVRYLDTVEKWSPDSQQWTSITNMNNGRSHFGAAVLNGEIFIVGGAGGGGILDKYVNKKWQKVSNLPSGVGRYTNAIELGGNLYVLTGLTAGRSPVFMFDGVSWSDLPDMNQARGFPRIAALNGKIYVAGGYNASVITLNTVEEFDPATNNWNFVASMRVKRLSPALVSQGGKLYVFGGYNRDDKYLASVEMYDPVTDKWTDVGDMKFCAGRVGAAVLRH